MAGDLSGRIHPREDGIHSDDPGGYPRITDLRQALQIALDIIGGLVRADMKQDT